MLLLSTYMGFMHRFMILFSLKTKGCQIRSSVSSVVWSLSFFKFFLPFEDIFYLPPAVRKTNNFIFPFAASSWSLCKVRYWSSFLISFAAIWGYLFFLIFLNILHYCLCSLNFLFGSLHRVSSRFRQDVAIFLLNGIEWFLMDNLRWTLLVFHIKTFLASSLKLPGIFWTNLICNIYKRDKEHI